MKNEMYVSVGLLNKIWGRLVDTADGFSKTTPTTGSYVYWAAGHIEIHQKLKIEERRLAMFLKDSIYHTE